MLHHEFIPAQTPKSDALWIMLHGLGDSIEGYRWMPEAMRLPWMNYLLVNAPDEYYGGFSWFNFGGDIVPGVNRSRGLLFELLDAQRAKGFPTQRTILGGFSQGCLMSLDAGLRYPHRLAGIVGISGFVCQPENLLKQLSPVAFEQHLLVTHGTKDPLIRFADVREQINLLKAAGLKLEFREFLKAHTIAGEEEIQVIRNFVTSCYPSA
ncbi:MAG: serine esterase [Verrucomicrobiota bacterium]